MSQRLIQCTGINIPSVIIAMQSEMVHFLATARETSLLVLSDDLIHALDVVLGGAVRLPRDVVIRHGERLILHSAYGGGASVALLALASTCKQIRRIWEPSLLATRQARQQAGLAPHSPLLHDFGMQWEDMRKLEQAGWPPLPLHSQTVRGVYPEHASERWSSQWAPIRTPELQLLNGVD